MNSIMSPSGIETLVSLEAPLDKIIPGKPLPSRQTPFGLWDDVQYYAALFLSALFSKISTGRVRQYFEDKALFQPKSCSRLNKIKSRHLAQHIGEDLFFESDQDVHLHGWYLPGDPEKPTVIFAQGNYGNMNHREAIMKAFANHQLGLFIFSYRGYGKSTGKPTEEGLYQDFKAASHYLSEVHHIPYIQQVAMGESLGGAVAIHAACEIPFQAVVVCSTFTQIPDVYDVFKQKIPLLKWLLVSNDRIKQHFSSIDKIQNIQCPILLIQGDQDPIVPLEMSQRLFFCVPPHHYKKCVVVEGGDHDNLFYIAPSEIMETMTQFLEGIPQ